MGGVVVISAVATSLLAQGEPPLGERVLVAAVGPLITVLVGGLVVWAVTSTVQHNRERAETKLQHEREDEALAREWRARDDALRHELVTKMTEAQISGRC